MNGWSRQRSRIRQRVGARVAGPLLAWRDAGQCLHHAAGCADAAPVAGMSGVVVGLNGHCRVRPVRVSCRRHPVRYRYLRGVTLCSMHRPVFASRGPRRHRRVPLHQPACRTCHGTRRLQGQGQRQDPDQQPTQRDTHIKSLAEWRQLCRLPSASPQPRLTDVEPGERAQRVDAARCATRSSHCLMTSLQRVSVFRCPDPTPHCLQIQRVVSTRAALNPAWISTFKDRRRYLRHTQPKASPGSISHRACQPTHGA